MEGGGITGSQGSQRGKVDERARRDVFTRFDGAGLAVEACC